MLTSQSDFTTSAKQSAGRVTPFSSETETPQLWMLWLYGYAYAFVVALVLQKLVLPNIPSLHAGHGLLNHDAIIFHDMAVAMANRIHALGWSEWRLVPGNGITGNVGILAAIYSVFGVDPAWFIPLNAGFHALGALLVLRLGLYLHPGRGGWAAGLTAALLFLVFPSALAWYGQNHKDAFLIVGYLLALFAFVRALERQTLLEMLDDMVLMSVGCALVTIMRPHMLLVYALGFAIALMFAALWKMIRPGCIRSPVIRNGALMLVIISALMLCAPKGGGQELVPYSAQQANALQLGWHWEKTELLPNAIDQKLEQASVIRAHFVATAKHDKDNNTVDGDITPINAKQMVAYLPRSLLVGLFAPFPDAWLDRPNMTRLIGAAEMLIFYLLAPGIFIRVWCKPSLPLFVCLIVSAVVLTVLSYTSPNVGTLHRIRFGPLFIFMLTGASGWIWLLGKVGRILVTYRDIPHLYKSFAPLGRGANDLLRDNQISGKRAMGVSVLVTFVLMIGALGLLIRDLLLINRSDFGHSLDSFYLTLMLPMLFVNTLSLPLGDALTATLHRMKNRDDVQSLLGATSAVSLLVLGILCLVLLLISDQFYRSFVGSGDIAQILSLLPFALSLLLFSGQVVVGNSLINSLDKPVLAAAAQLMVPLAAVVAILFAPEGHLIIMATAGMATGQLLNLLILSMVARRCGYRLFPSSIRPMRGEGLMLSNYGWLVIAATMASLSIPFNYWLAGQLGGGAVSIWAVGSKLVQMATVLGAAIMQAVWVPYFSKLAKSGLHMRIRSEFYLSLLASSWGGGLLALLVYVFAGPIVMVAMPAVQDEMQVVALKGVIQIGGLQLPILFSGLALLKLAAISEVSWKVVAATLIGLVANVGLGYKFMQIWGLLGIAAAWCIATLLVTSVIMFSTRAHSFLEWSDIFAIICSWIVIGAFALAIHFNSLAVTAGVILFGILMLVVQVKRLIISPNEKKRFLTRPEVLDIDDAAPQSDTLFKIRHRRIT